MPRPRAQLRLQRPARRLVQPRRLARIRQPQRHHHLRPPQRDRRAQRRLDALRRRLLRPQQQPQLRRQLQAGRARQLQIRKPPGKPLPLLARALRAQPLPPADHIARQAAVERLVLLQQPAKQRLIAQQPHAQIRQLIRPRAHLRRGPPVRPAHRPRAAQQPREQPPRRAHGIGSAHRVAQRVQRARDGRGIRLRHLLQRQRHERAQLLLAARAIRRGLRQVDLRGVALHRLRRLRRQRRQLRQLRLARVHAQHRQRRDRRPGAHRAPPSGGCAAGCCPA